MQSSSPLVPRVGGLSDSGNIEAKPGGCYFSSFPDLGDCQEPAQEAFAEVRENRELSSGGICSGVIGKTENGLNAGVD